MYASKNGDEVPRTGKKYIDWYGYILVGGLFVDFDTPQCSLQ